MKKIFILEFYFNMEDEEYGDIYKYIFIGVFNSEVEANKAIDELIKQPGFDKYPREYFHVGPNVIDMRYWSSGFQIIN